MPNINLGYRVFSNLLGKEGKAVLAKQEFLNAIGQVDRDLAASIGKSIQGIENPTFELTGKATANYNIAGLKIKNGEQTIGSGAFSVSRTDLLGKPELKGRLDLPNSKTIRTKGNSDESLYIDTVIDKASVKSNSSRKASLINNSFEENGSVIYDAGKLVIHKNKCQNSYNAIKEHIIEILKLNDQVKLVRKTHFENKQLDKACFLETPEGERLIDKEFLTNVINTLRKK